MCEACHDAVRSARKDNAVPIQHVLASIRAEFLYRGDKVKTFVCVETMQRYTVMDDGSLVMEVLPIPEMVESFPEVSTGNVSPWPFVAMGYLAAVSGGS